MSSTPVSRPPQDAKVLADKIRMLAAMSSDARKIGKRDMELTGFANNHIKGFPKTSVKQLVSEVASGLKSLDADVQSKAQRDCDVLVEATSILLAELGQSNNEIVQNRATPLITFNRGLDRAGFAAVASVVLKEVGTQLSPATELAVDGPAAGRPTTLGGIDI